VVPPSSIKSKKDVKGTFSPKIAKKTNHSPLITPKKQIMNEKPNEER
jgi:hypothetical protein